VPNNPNFIFSITGDVFEKLNNLVFKENYSKDPEFIQFFDFVLQNCYIYARMSPENKANLVEALKSKGNKVLMCGDGANDTGALRAADVGVSLSMEEASMAAHFTSKTSDVSCIQELLIEGKGGLVTTIQCFKFMMLYSIIQFSSTCFMIIIDSYLTDNQFLITDLFIIFPLAFLIARTSTSQVLTKEMPEYELKSFTILSSIICTSIMQILFQLFSYLIVINQRWYKPILRDEKDIVEASSGNTVIINLYLDYFYHVIYSVFSGGYLLFIRKTF